jgi:hypothetical protein
MIRTAEKVYDCLHRERYRYTLGAAVDERLLAQYADQAAFRVSVYDARHLLPQAWVTFRGIAGAGRARRGRRLSPVSIGASGRSPAKKLSIVKRRARAHGRCRA